MTGTSVSVSAAPALGSIGLGAELPDDFYLLEGKISRAWAELDYMQRIVIKRLKNLKLSVSANHIEIDKIFALKSQTDLVGAISTGATADSRLDAGEQSALVNLADAIGFTRSGSHLYGRRNNVVHALWAQSASGANFKLRCGIDDWQNPPPMPTQPELEQLLNDITGMVGKLENATAKIK